MRRRPRARATRRRAPPGRTHAPVAPDACLTETARDSGGEIANRLGDEGFCIFAPPDDAATAAAAMHERVEAASAHERLPRPVRIRAGCVHGPVVHSAEG